MPGVGAVTVGPYEDNNYTSYVITTNVNPAPASGIVWSGMPETKTVMIIQELPGVSQKYATYIGSGQASGLEFDSPQYQPGHEQYNTVLLKRKWYGNLLDGQIFYSAGGAQRNDIICLVVAEKCVCPNDHWNCCMSGKTYNYNVANVTFPGAGNPLALMFLGNQRRVSLTISCGDASAGAVVYVGTASNSGSIWLRLNSPGNIVLPYRDYGPIIREAVYVTGNSLAAGAQITGVDTYLNPQ